MNRKLKLALAALLGFSAACSTVKNTPVKGDNTNEQTAGVEMDSTRQYPQIIAMYGVRPPRRNTIIPRDSLDPVLEKPVDDAPVVKPRVSAQSTLDPVAEKPADE